MKNIHIIQTDKPSRLFYIKKILVLDRKKKIYSESYKNLHEYKNQNIYITSDEKIKEGNYTYHRVFGVGKITNVNGKKCFVTIKLSSTDGSITTPWKRNIPDIKKIILTTDQDLIKDGVQNIPDEFLEWICNNPSCEEVEVKSEKLYEHKDTYRPYPSECKNLTKTKVNYYLSIIPKEEPKQEINTCKNFDRETGCDLVDCPCEREKILFEAKEMVKQETLEDIELEEVRGSIHCQFSVVENKLAIIYRNQLKILQAIKMLNNER